MIQQVNSHDDSRGLELLRYLNVGRRRLKTTSRVIVGHDHCGRSIRQGVSEYFAGVDRRAIDESDGHHTDVQDLVRTVDASPKFDQ